MINNYLNEEIRRKYFLKVSPDISIFNLVEKNFCDNNIEKKTVKNNIFFNGYPETGFQCSRISLRVQSDFDVNSIPEKYPFYSFISGLFRYIIIITDEDEIKIDNLKNVDLIGVGF